ncbi:DNA polymerase III subunit delta [Candidatus Palibaumannia cicadellinicola]|uniref:DNA polymerase III subunit delta n=1 Tax=Candidatus Palibaumannia cicadellinicola TaxID=186490 RepID=A0A088N1C2_9GAMM|nr:DNA polymerase III subunit delta [Candidatus Baumannia cicadellinicola]AIN47146.1 DNA polymerase III delta subunit [Candidatus Baumannia cicadellinicola]
MIRIYPEQLRTQLQNHLRPCYLLLGNDLLLLQESEDSIQAKAQLLKFNEHFRVSLEDVTDWDTIFSLSQVLSLFAHRQTLLLRLPENGVTATIEKKLAILVSLLHPDFLLILRGQKLTRAQENSFWFKALSSNNAVLVDCTTPDPAQLPCWVKNRAKNMHLSLDDAACKLLCYCYEGNLPALVQALERLKLIHPDGILTLPLVEEAVTDTSYFTPFHWINAVLSGNSKRTSHILQQLRLEAREPVILLRYIQRDIFLLLTLKRHMAYTPARILFDQHKIWQNRRPLLMQALQRLSVQQLYQAIALMLKIELTVKQDYSDYVWADINALGQLLCSNTLFPTAMIDV